MTIDRIGKAGPAGAPTEAGGVGSVSGKRFDVGAATGTSGAGGVSPADQVRAGDMTIEAYVELRVSEATSHLDGKLGASDLASVRALLRSEIANDPAVRELVRGATGVLPPSEGDG